MASFTKGENKIGYKVTVWSSTGKTTSYRGFTEGDPLLDAKVQATVLKAAPEQALKAILGGGMSVSAMFLVAGAAGSALGGTVSAVLMEGLNKALLQKAGVKLSAGNTTIGVILAGDFEAKYKIKTLQDLTVLPGLLAIVPATFKKDGKPYWMGKSIIKILVNEQTGACIKGGNIDIKYTIDV